MTPSGEEERLDLSRHFVSVERFPLVEADTTLSTSLGIMRERGVGGLLVIKRREELVLLTGAEIAAAVGMLEFAGSGTPALPGRQRVEAEAIANMAMGQLVRGDWHLPIVPVTSPRATLHGVFAGVAPFRAVAVERGGRVIGIFTESEDFGHAMFVSAPFYRCGWGHPWPPPPPQPCPIDNTPVVAG